MAKQWRNSSLMECIEYTQNFKCAPVQLVCLSCPAHLINPVQLILRRAEADANLNHISPLYEELVFEAPAYVINITQKSPTKYGEKKIQRDTQGKSFSDIQTHGQSSWYKCTGGHDSIKTAHPIGESDSLSITFTTSFLNFVHFD